MSVAAGFWATSGNMTALDDGARYNFSQWLLYKYGLLADKPGISDYQTWYGAGWDLFLGLQTNFVFAWVSNPIWVRHAFTWALFPITLFLTYLLLRRVPFSPGTSLLAVSLLFATTRIGGHATQTKDFPPAMLFVLLTIYLWLAFADSKQRGEKLLPLPKVLGVAALCVLPYIVRPPLLMHTAALLGLLFLQAVSAKDVRWWRRLVQVLLPLLLSLIMIYALAPAMWSLGFFAPEAWLKPYTLFSDFFIRPTDYFYNVGYKPDNIPWWYSLGWLPLLGNFAVWIFTMTGIFLCLMTWPFKYTGRNLFGLTFKWWLLLFLGLNWIAVLIVQPSLYDGMRHLLFLYPLIPVYAGVGLSILPEKLKIILAMGLIIIGAVAYWQWGRYSYLYMPSEVGMNNVEHFSGDNRMICAGRAFEFMKKYAKEDTQVLAGLPYVYRRSEEFTTAESPRLSFTEPHKVKEKSGRIAIVNSKFRDQYQEAQTLLSSGKAGLLWVEILPNDDAICMVIKYADDYSE